MSDLIEALEQMNRRRLLSYEEWDLVFAVAIAAERRRQAERDYAVACDRYLRSKFDENHQRYTEKWQALDAVNDAKRTEDAALAALSRHLISDATTAQDGAVDHA